MTTALPGARRKLTARSVGIVCGILMLMSLVIPWNIRIHQQATFTMGWDVAGEPGTPVSVKAMLVGFWVIGLLALVFGLALKRLPLAVSYLSLAMVGVILVGVTLIQEDRGPRGGSTFLMTFSALAGRIWVLFKTSRRGDFALDTMLSAVNLMAMIAVLVLTTIRARLGRRAAICIATAILGGALIFLQVLSVALYAGDIGRLWDDMERSREDAGLMHAYLAVCILCNLAIAVGGLLALIDGVNPRSITRSMPAAAPRPSTGA